MTTLASVSQVGHWDDVIDDGQNTDSCAYATVLG